MNAKTVDLQQNEYQARSFPRILELILRSQNPQIDTLPTPMGVADWRTYRGSGYM